MSRTPQCSLGRSGRSHANNAGIADGVSNNVCAEDIEMGSLENHQLGLTASGVALSLEDFANLVKSPSNSSTVGQLVIQRVELRKSRRLPFRHEYVLVFVESQGRIYVIRLDRLGKLGSLVKGMRWHIGAVGIGGRSNDCVRIEQADSEQGRLLIEDINGSDQLLHLQHWSTLIEDRKDYLSLWKAAREVRKDRVKKFGPLHSQLGVRLAAILLDSNSLEEFSFSDRPVDETSFSRARHVPSYMPQLRQLLASIPDLVERRFCELSGRPFPLPDPVMISILQLVGHSKNTKHDGTLIRHFRFLHDISHQPLVLLDLALRLELMSRAWPKYNITTTNCELFSRSLCSSEGDRRFCFAAQGYVQVPTHNFGGRNPIAKSRETLTVLHILVELAVIYLWVVFLLMLGTVVGIVIEIVVGQIRSEVDLNMSRIGTTMIVVCAAFIVIPTFLLILATNLVNRSQADLKIRLRSELARSTAPPSSWTNDTVAGTDCLGT